ncbi:glycosyltransferase [Leptolyngbya sp. 7M]|uniref:glycosyltransferase n=1 Tax=Leptolyngbya sp. 7M TaxID=2812896 RepID=UPI001B8DA704|nr:glycosyltransferase family 4 protein [Leptolyngbya sp. 7M]QYO67909.1 glycosyltransferase family 4 protein [Leptolyngbya sp. 7M]
MRLRILTWHVHGSYLYYLTQAPHEFYLPVKPSKPEGYGGRLGGFAWGDNVHDIAADDVRHQSFDCILFQSRRNYEIDQYEILSEAQRQLPRLYLEHDPPRQHPTDTQHVVDDPNLLLVHVTHFNRLMWDSNRTPTCVIEHGVIVPEDIEYSGDLARGLVVANGLRTRGRRLGSDVFQAACQQVPLDLVGMDATSLGGLGEIPHAQLAAFQSRYRFFFHPVRYTSLGLAVCEAMMLGLPIVGLATTELTTVIQNHVSGYVNTNVDALIQFMQELIADPDLAKRLGQQAKADAKARFNIQRFVQDWQNAFEQAIALSTSPLSLTSCS